MNETIEQKLDMLAEFHAQKDLLEIDKCKLLDDVKIPAEVEAIVSEGMKAMAEIEGSMRATAKTFDALIEKELSEIAIPNELAIKLANLDRQRAELMKEFSDIEKQRATINAKKCENDDFLTRSINVRKQELQTDIEGKTKAVYAQVAQHKNEIEAEFSGKAEDVEENIKKLEIEIKAEVKAGKKSVKGKSFHAIYVSGRITWNTDKMEAWLISYPFLKDARKEGEPSITLRRV